MIRESAEAGHIVIAAGGGGIPIVKKADGSYEGVEAVIDKDLTSSILANEIGAEIFIILTEVPCVYTGYGKPSQKAIGAITAEQLGELVAAGEFPPAAPNLTAENIAFNEVARRAIVTDPETMPEALLGRGGTHIIGGC